MSRWKRESSRAYRLGPGEPWRWYWPFPLGRWVGFFFLCSCSCCIRLGYFCLEKIRSDRTKSDQIRPRICKEPSLHNKLSELKRTKTGQKWIDGAPRRSAFGGPTEVPSSAQPGIFYLFIYFPLLTFSLILVFSLEDLQEK